MPAKPEGSVPSAANLTIEPTIELGIVTEPDELATEVIAGSAEVEPDAVQALAKDSVPAHRRILGFLLYTNIRGSAVVGLGSTLKAHLPISCGSLIIVHAHVWPVEPKKASRCCHSVGDI